MITLEELLLSRDRRVERQRSLLGLYPGKALLCLTVQFPGPVKRDSRTLKVAAAAVEAVRGAFDVVFEELRDLETGYEGYFVVDMDPLEAKRRAVSLEEGHPLGRLFDLDVIVHKNTPILWTAGPETDSCPQKHPVFVDGTLTPLGREALGLPPRPCLICGRPARECMRARTHSPEELQDRIDVILSEAKNPKQVNMYKSVKSGDTYIVSLDNHVEITEAIAAFCEEKGILSGSINGLGAVSEATFRYLNPETLKYVDKTFTEQMELTSIVGNISRKDGKVYLHIHITASRSDYSCIGGHLLKARINGACELFITQLGVEVGRRADAETGINLYEF